MLGEIIVVAIIDSAAIITNNILKRYINDKTKISEREQYKVCKMFINTLAFSSTVCALISASKGRC